MDTTLQTLIAANIDLLGQAANLLGRLNDDLLTRTARGLRFLRIGGHLRHVLEFYECFLDGIASGVIDYGRRRRNRDVETDRKAALASIRSIAGRLERLSESLIDDQVIVRAEDIEDREALLQSSVSRELQVLSSHSTHHFALIAVTAQLLGIPVDPDFGVAPSTLRYRRSNSRAEVAA